MRGLEYRAPLCVRAFVCVCVLFPEPLDDCCVHEKTSTDKKCARVCVAEIVTSMQTTHSDLSAHAPCSVKDAVCVVFFGVRVRECACGYRRDSKQRTYLDHCD